MRLIDFGAVRRDRETRLAILDTDDTLTARKLYNARATEMLYYEQAKQTQPSDCHQTKNAFGKPTYVCGCPSSCSCCESHWNHACDMRIVSLYDSVEKKHEARLHALHVKIDVPNGTNSVKSLKAFMRAIDGLIINKNRHFQFEVAIWAAHKNSSTRNETVGSHHLHVQLCFKRGATDQLLTCLKECVNEHYGVVTKLAEIHIPERWVLSENPKVGYRQGKASYADIKRQAMYILKGMDLSLIRKGPWKPYGEFSKNNISLKRLDPRVQTFDPNSVDPNSEEQFTIYAARGVIIVPAVNLAKAMNSLPILNNALDPKYTETVEMLTGAPPADMPDDIVPPGFETEECSEEDKPLVRDRAEQAMQAALRKAREQSKVIYVKQMAKTSYFDTVVFDYGDRETALCTMHYDTNEALRRTLVDMHDRDPRAVIKFMMESIQYRLDRGITVSPKAMAFYNGQIEHGKEYDALWGPVAVKPRQAKVHKANERLKRREMRKELRQWSAP